MRYILSFLSFLLEMVVFCFAVSGILAFIIILLYMVFGRWLVQPFFSDWWYV
jgi:hypothetical protein